MRGQINALIAEIEKSTEHLDRLAVLYQQQAVNLADRDKTLEKAVFLSEIFVNYYTCLESIFFRIAQFFENALPTHRWHRTLLENMCLQIPDIREAVISDEMFYLLDEFRKFRHFKRYYYSMDYDWDKLDYLAKKFDKVIKQCPEQISCFVVFLKRLKEQDQPRD